MSRSRFLLAALAVLGAVGSCAPVDRKTQITVALASETEIPQELDAFVLRVLSTRTGELRFSNDYSPTSGRDFPTTLAVIPVDEDSLGSPVRIELEGLKNGRVFLRRQAVISYSEGRNLLLSMPLRMACFQFRDCGPSATCAGGECVPVKVEPSSLADYDPGLVFGSEGACFDEEACLPDGIEVEVREDCSFAIPAGVPSGTGNVSIQWAVAPNRILALDADDAQEGWTRLADDRGRLSKGVCDSHFQRRGSDGLLLVPDFAERVYFSASCASKTSRRPYCLSARTQHAGIGAIRR